MLQTPDVKTANILKVADRIEKLAPCMYDQDKYISGNVRCICGWINHWYTGASENDTKSAGDFLGLEHNDAFHLFAGKPLIDKIPDTKLAAKVLRHLAVTGEVNWSL